MEILISPKHLFPSRGLCVHIAGDYVTEAVHQVVAELIHDNLMTSPAYIARKEACAFFQGGSNDPKGKWVLIEFWAKEEKCAEFMKLLNERISAVIDPTLTKITIDCSQVKPHVFKDFCNAVSDSVICKYEVAEDNVQEVTFFPENNIRYDAILYWARNAKFTQKEIPAHA